jgi:hypothetical protein
MKNRLLTRSPGAFAACALAALVLGLAIPCRAQEDVIPYGAGGYRYQSYANLAAVPADWASPAFDESGLADGGMPFGSWELGGASCPLAAEANTVWPSPSALLVRRTFVLPRGARDVTIHLGVDNDALVAVNGNLLGVDWIVHEGCPVRDEFFYDVPAEFLNGSGNNVLAVLAHDRGAESWIDVRLTVGGRSPLRLGSP